MRIQESAENYLETILKLTRRGSPVRSIDIANTLGFSKPSVSHAMKRFRENGYIQVEDGLITLTEGGLKIAEQVYERHTELSRFLRALGVSPAAALEDACKMEHDISEETFSAIKRWMAEHPQD